MNSALKCKFAIPEALRLDHDELRTALVCATAESGPVGKAAMRLARYCLPHFAREKYVVFPLFGLLDELASGDIRPEMADLLPLIYACRSGHASKEHRSIDAAIEALLHAARTEGCAHIVEFAVRLQLREQIKDAVIYPAVALIGKYLRRRLGRRSDRRQGLSRVPTAEPDPIRDKFVHSRRLRDAAEVPQRNYFAAGESGRLEPSFSA